MLGYLATIEAVFRAAVDMEAAGDTRAVDVYHKVVERNPKAVGALVNLGTIYYRQRKFDEAEKFYSAAIDADPAYPLAQFNLGNLYEEQGRIQDAMDHYRVAASLDFRYVDAYFNFALLLQRNGKFRDAARCWNLVVRFGSSQDIDIACRCAAQCRREYAEAMRAHYTTAPQGGPQL